MKRWFLGAALSMILLVALEARAEAQGVTVEYKKKTKSSELVLTFVGGSYWGYGFGSSFFSSYVPGMYGRPYGPWVYPGTFPFLRTYSPYYYGSRPVYNYAPVYLKSPVSAERVAKIRAEKEISDGIRFFKAGDYAGALAAFKRAYLQNLDSGVVQLYIGISLVGTGDLRNAEKAFAGAFRALRPDQALGIDLPSLFGNAKIEAAYLRSLRPDRPSAGIVAYLLGRKAEARKILSALPKDPTAAKILRALGEE